MFENKAIQKNISAGGDVAGRDINNFYGVSVTRYQRWFQKLATEIEQDKRYNKTIDNLKYYETVLDGTKGLKEKLNDGGRTSEEISKAIRQKQKFAKKQEKYKYYESAQWINSHLFAEILLLFEDNVKPKIEEGCDKQTIISTVAKLVVRPMLNKLNIEGSDDEYLGYDAEDIYGMIYYLTGGCHINWKDYSKDYSNVQPSI